MGMTLTFSDYERQCKPFVEDVHGLDRGRTNHRYIKQGNVWEFEKDAYDEVRAMGGKTALFAAAMVHQI